MSVSLSDLLAGINVKCDILARRCRDLEESNRKLQQQLEKAVADLDLSRKELDEANRRLNYTTIASNFDSGKRDSSRQTSKIISDMVRKIDRCISRLEAE